MIVVNSSNLCIKLFLYTYNNSKPNHSLRINSLLIENLRIKHVKQKKKVIKFGLIEETMKPSCILLPVTI